MSRKVFMTVLGAGFYSPGRYYKQETGFVSSDTRYIQQATIEYLGIDEIWSENDKIAVLLTQKSRQDNWQRTKRINTKSKEEEEYLGLYNVLHQMVLKPEIVDIDIDDGKNQSEIWNIFQKAYEFLSDGDEVYFDLTHGFRYLPMLVLVLGNYSKFLKNISVKSITYGNFEMKDEIGSPIIDLLPLSILQDWTFAAADYIKNGNADKLSEYSHTALLPLLKNSQTRTEDVLSLNNSIKKLRDFSNDLKTCRGLKILNADSLRIFFDDIKKIDANKIPPLAPVFDRILEDLEVFSKQFDINNAVKAAKLCFEKQLYQSAITFLEEGVVSWFCIKYNIPIDDDKHRENVNRAIRIKQSLLESQNRKRAGEVDVSGDAAYNSFDVNFKQIEILSDEMLGDSEFINTFVDITEVRNDYNHCGMRSTRSPLESSKIIAKIESDINKIEKLFLKHSLDLTLNENTNE